ncbi:hypothetical protein [Planktothrix agardhii]|uniref:hypothetical protein n=1 Tax=Planktothrix agardhii TaxID=1160 RepID=UPI001F40E907|nr:hypothetical protein [Planktothrix agardhii]MCB8780344.1 hypothetical protein [Planktothrix agardhii 1808]
MNHKQDSHSIFRTVLLFLSSQLIQYIQELAQLHQELMNLGEWWLGIENEVFG